MYNFTKIIPQTPRTGQWSLQFTIFRGHVNVLIYTDCEVAGGLGGAEGVFGFRDTQVQKETDV